MLMTAEVTARVMFAESGGDTCGFVDASGV